MPKPKSGYKRQSTYDRSQGVEIPIRTEEAYTILKKCATGNRCTIGQWAENRLRYALTGTPYIGTPRRPATTTPVKKPRSFQLDDRLHDAIVTKVGEDKALAWIASTLLFLAEIEIRRQSGERAEREWCERYRI